MRIDYAIPCRYTEATGNLGTIVGAGIDTWMVHALPADLGVMVAVRAVGAPADVVGEMVSLHCHVEGPNGQSAGAPLDQELGPIEAPDVRQDWSMGLILPIAIRWRAESEGTYTLHLRVDQSEHPIPLHVVRAS